MAFRTFENPPSNWFRFLAVLMAVAFFQLEWVALNQGTLAVQAGKASVGKERRVAVMVLPRKASGAGDAQVLQTLVRGEVAKLAGVRLLTGSPEPGASLAGTVGQQVEEGIRALNSRDHAAAEAALSAAYEELVRYTGALDRRLMARTLKGLGVARAMAGQITAAQDMMRASLNLWPSQRAPEYAYTLDVLQTFKGVERMREEQGRGTIAVVTEPEGAEISIDGRVRGYAPLAVADLEVGKHWVQAQYDGTMRSGSFVELAADEEVAHRVALQERPNMAAWKQVMKMIPRAFRSKTTARENLPALISLLQADEALVLQASARGRNYELSGWYAAGGNLQKVKVLLTRDASFLSGLQSFLSTTLVAEASPDTEGLGLDAPPSSSVLETAKEDNLYIDPDDPILKTRGEEAQRSITREWWFWGAVGGVATALTVGAVFLLSGEDEGKGPVGSIHVQLNSIEGL